MTDFEIDGIAAFIIALLLGAVLSGIYFGAMWLTLRSLSYSRQPALLLTLSLLVRLTLLFVSFYWILGDAHWDRLLAALFGFVMVRTLMLQTLKPNANERVTASRTETSS